ncbi:MAG: VanZ family protein [Anaerolineaceae bacterium]|nr:VanZ family protein [Anaerolineaceae bacterium]
MLNILSAYVDPIRTAVLLFPFALFLFFIPFSVVQFGRFVGWRMTVVYAFIFFLMSAYALVLLPLPDITPGFCTTYGHMTTPQLEPFSFVRNIGGYLADHSLLETLQSFVFLEVFFNFLLLLPLGFLLRYLFQMELKTVAVIAFLVSLSFEVTQLTAIYGLYPCPYRLFSVDDLIMNTLGAIVGYLIVPLFFFLPHVDRDSLLADPTDTVSLLRRFIALITDLFILSIIEIFVPQSPLNTALLYTLWFVLIPWRTGGFTLGKWMVRIRLININGERVGLWQLVVRYFLLFFSPNLVAAVADSLSRPNTDGYVEGFGALLSLGLSLGFYLVYFVPPLFRSDHRGFHEWFSHTAHYIVPIPSRRQ